MSNLAEVSNNKREFSLEVVTKEILLNHLELTGISNKLSKSETNHFISIARAFNLNPLKREIHISVYGQGENKKISIVTGYEVYIKRAAMSGLLDGWQVTTEGEGKGLKAVIQIQRKDFSKPFIHEVYYSEYVQYTKDGKINKFWDQKALTMIKKVAISQGFRLCFCEYMDGLPYTEDEIEFEREVNPIQNNPAPVVEIQKPKPVKVSEPVAVEAKVVKEAQPAKPEVSQNFPEGVIGPASTEEKKAFFSNRDKFKSENGVEVNKLEDGNYYLTEIGFFQSHIKGRS